MTEETGFSEGKCWYCGLITTGHFCQSCHKIQPIEKNITYFSFFNLPRHFHINLVALEENFYKLSKKFHPDFFFQASETERQYSMEKSSMLNDAYRSLKDSFKRANYLLALEGIKDIGQKTPSDLLAEVFELNEQIEELRYAKQAKDSKQISTLKAQVLEMEQTLKTRSDKLQDKLNQIFLEFDKLPNSASELEKQPILTQAVETLSEMKYINNLIDSIEEELD